MRIRIAFPALLMAATLLSACGEEAIAPESASPAEVTQISGGPSNVISDAAHGGRAGFYFLSPMVKEPNYTGAFDPTLSPTVLVRDCGTIAPTTAASCPAPGITHAVFSGAAVEVHAKNEKYKVHWDTDASNALPGHFYRVVVSVVSNGVPVELGFADVQMVDKRRELKNVSTGEFIGMVDGRRIPIKFRIERGADRPDKVPPTAVEDNYPHAGAPDLMVGPTVSVSAADGLLSNDLFGLPAATISAILGTNNQPLGSGTILGGTLSVNQATGAFTLTGASIAGTESFKYVLTNDASSDTASVTITLTAPVVAPDAVNDAFQGVTGTALGGNLWTNDQMGSPAGTITAVLGTDNQPLGSSTILGGVLSVNMTTGAFTLTGAAAPGSAGFKYVLSNAAGADTALVTITLTTPVIPPTAMNDFFQGYVSATISGNVLSNDDGGSALSLSAQLVAGGQSVSQVSLLGGTATLTGGGWLSISGTTIPGVDTLHYQALDGMGGAANGLVIITVVAVPQNQLIKVAGDGQTATVGTAVAVAPRVRWVNGFGNPIAGATVTFTVGNGSSIAVASATTDAAGEATVGTWTLGPVSGTYYLAAQTAGGYVQFSATAQAPSGGGGGGGGMVQ